MAYGVNANGQVHWGDANLGGATLAVLDNKRFFLSGSVAEWEAFDAELDASYSWLSKSSLVGVMGEALAQVEAVTGDLSTHAGIVTGNPHAVDASDVSLGNVTNDAQLKLANNDFGNFTLKGTPVAADRILIEDSAGGTYVKKYTTLTDLLGGSLGGSLGDDEYFEYGAAPDFYLGWNTTGQTTSNAMILGTTGGNNIIICENDDKGFNFAHVASAQPRLIIHSENQDVLEYLEMYYDQATDDAKIHSGEGGLRLYAGSLGTSNYVKIGETGSSARGMTYPNDLYIDGKLEVSAQSYFDGAIALNGACVHNGITQFKNYVSFLTGSSPVEFADDIQCQFGSLASSAVLVWSTNQTADAFMLGLGFASRTVIVCDYSHVGSDFEHANQLNPTVIIHSDTGPGTAAGRSEWISLTHDQTDGQIVAGKGTIAFNDPDLTSAIKFNDGSATLDTTDQTIIGAINELVAAGDLIDSADLYTAEASQTNKVLTPYTANDVRWQDAQFQTGLNETWTYDNTITDGDPGLGNFRANHLTFPSATFLYFDTFAKSNFSMSQMLLRLRVGDYITVQQDNSSGNYSSFEVSGTPTDGTGYIKVPVTGVNYNGDIVDGSQCGFRFFNTRETLIHDHLDAAGGSVLTPTAAGLANVTNDAQLKRSANDFASGIALKATPEAADRILIEDNTGATWTKKYTTLTDLLGIAYGDDEYLYLGDSDDAAIVYSTSDVSNPSLRMGVPATNRVFSICRIEDIDTDFGLADVTDPWLMVHNANPIHWFAISHDGLAAVHQTSPNSWMRMIANGSGYFAVGTGYTSHGLSGPGVALISSELEVDGTTHFDGIVNIHASAIVGGTSFTLEDDVPLYFGDAADAGIVYSTADVSNPNLKIGVPATNRVLSIVQKEDLGVDLAFTEPITPVLAIHAAASPSTKYMYMYHSGVDAYMTTSSGGKLRLNPDSYVAIGIGSTSHSLATGADLLVSDDFEVNGTSYFDGEVACYSSLTANGPVRIVDSFAFPAPTTASTTSYTALTSDNVIICSNSSGCTITLTNLSGTQGACLWITDSSGTTATIGFTGMNSIAGGGGTFSKAYGSQLIMEIDGAGNWAILASY